MTDLVTGYKATDKNMQCRGFQFEIGKWHKHDGELAMCESGFHFCEYPSGPWCFYSDNDTRIFKVEARGVLRGEGAGADLKHVAMEIRLIEEIPITGDGNTGDGNTGDRNTGHRNTGDGNTGDWNTGDGNTGDWNTGDRNTGHRNTGDWNTGHRNTGHWNTGDGNTGHWNTGDWNTGDGNTGDWNTGHRNTGHWNTGDGNTGDGNTGHWNTGDGNTGDGNVGDRHSGFFCKIPVKKIFFDEETDRPHDGYAVFCLSKKMLSDEPFEPTEQDLSIPNATREKILSLHKAHIAARK